MKDRRWWCIGIAVTLVAVVLAILNWRAVIVSVIALFAGLSSMLLREGTSIGGASMSYRRWEL
jgi:hypothetical protein